jgi:hypothetical protein
MGRAHKSFWDEYFRWQHQHPPKEGDEALFIAGYGKLAVGMSNGRTSLAQGQTSLAKIQILTIETGPELVRLMGWTSPARPKRFLLKELD